MCASLSPGGFDEFYLNSVFKVLSVISRVPVNLNSRGPKIGTLHADPKTRNGDFIKGNIN
jgi:hypothetical protein